MGEFDLFDLYRWGLATVCAVYASVRMGQTLWRWLDYFGGSRQGAIMGRYVSVQLLRLRFRRFLFDLVQIGVLLGMFGYLIYGHHKVG